MHVVFQYSEDSDIYLSDSYYHLAYEFYVL